MVKADEFLANLTWPNSQIIGHEQEFVDIICPTVDR